MRTVLSEPSSHLWEASYPHLGQVLWLFRKQLLPLGQFSFVSRLLVRRDEINRSDAQRTGELEQAYDGWIAAAAFQVADVLLSKAGQVGELLLRKALLLPQLCEIPADQLAHVHSRKLRLTYYEVYLL